MANVGSSSTPDQTTTPPSPAPPSASPARESRRRLYIGIGVVVAIVVIVLGAYGLGVGTAVKVTGENFAIDYAGTSSGYFGTSPLTFSVTYSYTTGADIAFNLTVTNSAKVLHNVTSITLASPFTLVSTSPSLPVNVSAGGSTSVVILATLPSSSGTYELDGTVTTY